MIALYTYDAGLGFCQIECFRFLKLLINDLHCFILLGIICLKDFPEEFLIICNLAKLSTLYNLVKTLLFVELSYFYNPYLD